MTRAEAARLAGMERQASHGAVTRYNVEGSTGAEGPAIHPGPSEGEEVALAGLILRPPDPKHKGILSYTRKDIALLVE